MAVASGVIAGATGAGGALAQTIAVHAAGSLRAPLTQAAQAFEQAHPGTRIALSFGASGLLRDRIAGGEPADVFASANMAHPQSLSAGGAWGPTRAFARNALCALVRPGLGVTRDTLVKAMLDPEIRVGTSTPKADPSGDYAFELFDRVERSGAAPAGSASALAAKSLQLTGGPNSPAPPAGRNVYGMLVANGQADVFLTYCTNAVIAVAEEPGLQRVDVPPSINVSAEYGVVVRKGAPAAAQAFADELVGGAGQRALRQAGFLAP
ncbi:molybdate ABC transporter substrate-binding protein [Variovorax sp. WS11]|uniref:extracellular solute-binding protein n=1 Tax=Variovorax sp. WS11 TaxID=1105204 RepID=UPI000D0DD476|nr:extracellular solute-binding protein [Variovorax sp. WS11]NDZ12376.1 extracellular solute-binding protein [Variovorax sp. WS11]PSL85369.1 molybdate ABC transporter substrate-binding protein [Variovorax sp. WS11]